jgi:hypothetical protein
MNKTCLFLIFLIAPLAFCQHEILNMLDNTPEGKEVLDALFIQTKLMGENLDAASLRQFLNANYKRVQSEKAATSQHHKKRSAECKSDLKQLAAFLHEHEDRQLELKRRVEFIKRASKVNKGFLERADEELTNYKKFEGYIKQNKAAWSTYYKTVTTNFNKVSEILKNALSALRPKKGAAFVEVQEETFSTSLAEIRLQVEATDAEFVGMGPILSNLVEIMAEAVNKTEVRQKTRELVHLLIDNVRDRLEELDEENEHQSALFDHLEKTFHENVKRSEKEVDTLKTTHKAIDARMKNIQESHVHSVDLTDRVQKIHDIRAEECVHYKSGNASAQIRREKVRSIITQVEEIIVNQTSGLKSFFLQREMRQN